MVLSSALSDLLDEIEPEVLGIPAQRWDGEKGHKQLCLHLVEGPLSTRELLFKQGGGDIELLRQRLRDLRRSGIVNAEKEYLSPKRKGPYRNIWTLLPNAISLKAQEQNSTKSLIEELQVKQQRMLHEADWGSLGFSDHAAWRLAEMCAAYEKNPMIPTVELTLLLVADKATVNRWRRDLLKPGLLKLRNSKGRQWQEVQWGIFEKLQSVDLSGRKLAPTRAVTRLSERTPKEDRRTEEQQRCCEILEAEDLGLSGYAWGAFKVISAAIGTRRFTTREELAAELGGGRRSIDRVLPELKKNWLKSNLIKGVIQGGRAIGPFTGSTPYSSLASRRRQRANHSPAGTALSPRL